MNDSEREKAMQCSPGDWPSRQVVDLDNLGDPGFWLENRFEEVKDALTGGEEAVNAAAVVLAEAYLASAAELSFPVPSDFGASEEEELQTITEEFRAFLHEWRRRILADNKGNA